MSRIIIFHLLIIVTLFEGCQHIDNIGNFKVKQLDSVVDILNRYCSELHADYRTDSSGLTNFVLESFYFNPNYHHLNTTYKNEIIKEIRKKCETQFIDIYIRNNGVIEFILEKRSSYSITTYFIKFILYDPYFHGELLRKENTLSVDKIVKIDKNYYYIEATIYED